MLSIYSLSLERLFYSKNQTSSPGKPTLEYVSVQGCSSSAIRVCSWIAHEEFTTSDTVNTQLQLTQSVVSKPKLSIHKLG